MKLIKLNESQYKMLFESIKSRNIHINESSDEDWSIYYDYVTDYDAYYVLSEFFNNPQGKQDWGVLINPSMYKKALSELTKYGKLINFPSKYVYQWMGIIMKNTAILRADTDLAGHSGQFPGYEVAEFAENIDGIEIEPDYGEGSEWLWKKGLYKWMKMPDGSDAWSDYGLDPLETIFAEYDEDLPPEKVLVLVNRALDVYHQRGDVASIFIQGGSKVLSKISENVKRSIIKAHINETKKNIMKLIKLNESQYKRLFEMDSFVKTGGNSESLDDVPNEETKDETWVAGMITKDGENTYSDPPGNILKGDPHATDFCPRDRRLGLRGV